MRFHKRIDATGEGSVALTPDTVEDMWHIYNLMAVGDRVKASTSRKV